VRGRRVLVAALAAALLAAGCDDGRPPVEEPAGEQWAGAVDQWLTNWQAAGRAGVPNLSAFLAPDVVIDRRGSAEGVAEGRDAALSLYRVLLRRDPERELRGPAYLAPTGVVALEHASLAQPDSGADSALLLTLGADGLEREESLLSVLTGRWRTSVWPNGSVLDDWEPLEALADRWVAVWAQGETSAAEALYAPDAVVTDGLLGMRLEGVPAVEQAAHVTTPLRVAMLPDLGGPAVFGAAPPLSPAFDRALLVLEGDDGRCPGRVAVSVRLDATGRITNEDRYHRVDDARRCLPSAARSSGWWAHLSVPGPVPQTRTGTVMAGGKEVEIYNGTPALQQLVDWAVGRFQRAGLPVPRPASVTFYEAAPDECQGYGGLASGEGLTEISVCFGEARACPDEPCPPWSTPARQLVLHELGHTWLSQNLDDEDRERFSGTVGLTWADLDEPWERRAIERAAETVAWGLDEWRVPVRDFGSPSPERLADDFRILTGAAPLARPSR
jgi:hypothetical protein